MFREMITMLSRPYTVEGYVMPTVADARMMIPGTNDINLSSMRIPSTITSGDQRVAWRKRFFTKGGMERFLERGKSPANTGNLNIDKFYGNHPHDDFKIQKRSANGRTVEVFDNALQASYD